METMLETFVDRDIRQRELVPPDKLSETEVTIVGVGAIGRQVAIQLTAIGVPYISLIDFDHVAVENLSAQGFLEKDLGTKKVNAVAELCRHINTSIQIDTTNSKFMFTQFTSGVLMCCVDGIETRKSIFNAVKNIADLFIDGRMSAEYMRIFTAYNKESREHYETTLFPVAEAYRGSCTARTTIYCANIAAGLMVSQFAQWLRGCDIDMEIDLNLLTNEMGSK